MVNSNGTILSDKEALLSLDNRGFTYGDAVFETIRVNAGVLLFWEDHYFRLMASMRILRMQIPMTFTPEFLQEQILQLVEANGLAHSAVRAKIIVNRKSGGLYTPTSSEIDYVIQTTPISAPFYTITDQPYEVTLYKDHYVAKDLLSTLKSNNKLVNVLGSVFASENGFENCFLLNTEKMVIEALNGNIFLIKGNTIKTPPISDGCLKGILRSQLLKISKKLPDFTIEETSISPFELQKADEIFITNVISGIVPVTKFRKKEYGNTIAKKLLGMLNASIRLQKNVI